MYFYLIKQTQKMALAAQSTLIQLHTHQRISELYSLVCLLFHYNQMVAVTVKTLIECAVLCQRTSGIKTWSCKYSPASLNVLMVYSFKMKTILVFWVQIQELLFLTLSEISFRVGKEWCTVLSSVHFKEHDCIIQSRPKLSMHKSTERFGGPIIPQNPIQNVVYCGF